MEVEREVVLISTYLEDGGIKAVGALTGDASGLAVGGTKVGALEGEARGLAVGGTNVGVTAGGLAEGVAAGGLAEGVTVGGANLETGGTNAVTPVGAIGGGETVG